MHNLEPPDSQARTEFCRWFQQPVHDGSLDPGLTFFTDEAWFTLRGRVNSQNNRYWSQENPHDFHELPLHDSKIGVWCAVSENRILGPIFYEETINSDRYVRLILTPFFEQLVEEEKLHRHFMQDNATAHTANNSMDAIDEIFGERVISRRLWPARSPDLNPCDFYLWGMLKDRVYVNNPRTLDALKENIRGEINAITREELQRVSNNFFSRCQACIRAEGQHFEN